MRNRRNLVRECRECVGHAVDSFCQCSNFAFGFNRQLLGKIAVGHGRHHFYDTPYLVSKVVSHYVHVVRQIFPGTCNTRNLCLAAKFTFGSHFTCHTSYLGREAVQLIHHRVDRVLQLQNFSAYVDGNLARQVAARNSGGYLCNTAHLVGKVGRHYVYVIGQILPGTCDTRHARLASELSFGTYFPRYPRYFGRKAVELIHHRIDRVFQLQDFAFYIHGDFA